MSNKTLSAAVSTLLMVCSTSPVFAASNTVQISSSNKTVFTQPKVNLDQKTIRAINNPRLPSAARIPEKKIKPKHVPVIDQLQPGRPSDRGKLSGVAHQPRVEASTPITIEKPQLETNIQSEQIKQMQDSIAAVQVLEQIKNLPNAGEIPERVSEDQFADTPLGGHRPGVAEDQDVNSIVRELLLGRGGGFESAGIGAPGNHSEFSDPARAVPGKPSHDSRVAGDGDGTDAIIGFFTGGDSDGLQSWLKAAGTVVGEVSSAAAFPITVVTFWDSMRGSNAGEVNVSPQIASDVDGDGRPDMSRGDTRDHLQEDTDGDGVPDQSIDPDEPDTNQGGTDGNDQISQPGEGQGWSNPNACNYNPITRKCQGNARVSREAMTGQPPKTNDQGTGTGSGAPNVGAVAVTNPGENPNFSGSSGGGISTGEGTVDPEEIVPGGPIPAPGGTSASSAAPLSEAAMDEAMGVAALD